MDSDKRHDLSHREEKRNRVNEPEQPQNHETRQPIRISAREKLGEKIVGDHRNDRISTILAPTTRRFFQNADRHATRPRPGQTLALHSSARRAALQATKGARWHGLALLPRSTPGPNSYPSRGHEWRPVKSAGVQRHGGLPATPLPFDQAPRQRLRGAKAT